MDVTQIIENFKESWLAFNEQLKPGVKVEDINRGDCGLAAIAVAIVANEFGQNVDIIMNDAHCWVRQGTVDMDTLYPSGYPGPVEETWKTNNSLASFQLVS